MFNKFVVSYLTCNNGKQWRLVLVPVYFVNNKATIRNPKNYKSFSIRYLTIQNPTNTPLPKKKQTNKQTNKQKNNRKQTNKQTNKLTKKQTKI